MTGYFICVLIATIIETADSVLARVMKISDTTERHPLILFARITLWSSVFYVYFSTAFYYLDLGINKILAP